MIGVLHPSGLFSYEYEYCYDNDDETYTMFVSAQLRIAVGVYKAGDFVDVIYHTAKNIIVIQDAFDNGRKEAYEIPIIFDLCMATPVPRIED